ncbi:hypothetical protein AYL99_11958 [Fonsecaea erecta]|uniref:Uncharacterized protein n=1 Tax=Fonsecaea erecta TaxID=1367422 RepID=A0A178Z406_9EURO|nr:hypothetical protein AYL99_11958 [Fonsecaea erecta]OAP53835.1 hypothetical protein AYL99_11958 [Fonsecaea erecta]
MAACDIHDVPMANPNDPQLWTPPFTVPLAGMIVSPRPDRLVPHPPTSQSSARLPRMPLLNEPLPTASPVRSGIPLSNPPILRPAMHLPLMKNPTYNPRVGPHVLVKTFQPELSAPPIPLGHPPPNGYPVPNEHDDIATAQAGPSDLHIHLGQDVWSGILEGITQRSLFMRPLDTIMQWACEGTLIMEDAFKTITNHMTEPERMFLRRFATAICGYIEKRGSCQGTELYAI